MSTHGTPSWSNPVLQAGSTHAPLAPEFSELRRMLFELRNLLENSSDRQAALDVVESIEEMMSLPAPQEARPSHKVEAHSRIDLCVLVDEALRAVSPDIEAADVIVLRRGIRKAEVVAQHGFAVRLVEDVLRYAIDACSKSPRLRVTRICVRKGSRNLCQLVIDHNGVEATEDSVTQLLAKYPQMVSDGADGRLIVRFLCSRNPH